MKDSKVPEPLTPPGSPSVVKSSVSTTSKDVREGPGKNQIIHSHLPSPSPSPERDVSPRFSKEPEVRQIREPMNFEDLRNELGIDMDIGKCGFFIPAKQRRCIYPAYTFARRRTQVNNHIRSMTGLTQSSPDFGNMLEGLIDLVTCPAHRKNPFRNTRFAEWKAIFPEPVTSIDDQICEALGKVKIECEDESCTKRIGGRKVLNWSRTIDMILLPEIYSNDENLEKILKVLGWNQYCDFHAKNYRANVASRKALIIEIRGNKSRKLSSSSISTLCRLRDQVLAEKDASTSTNSARTMPTQPARALSSAGSTRAYSSKANQDPPLNSSNFWPETYVISPFDITARGDKIDENLSVLDQVKKVLLKDLRKDDEKDSNGYTKQSEESPGYIYLYKVPGNEGLVKLGYTKNDVELRLNYWRFECNRDLKQIYPNPGNAVTVPNAHRVEALCHAELDLYRIKHYCKACLKHHIEWFQVEAEVAIAVIEKWSEWMRTSPYTAKTRSDVQKLTMREREKTNDMSNFI